MRFATGVRKTESRTHRGPDGSTPRADPERGGDRSPSTTDRTAGRRGTVEAPGVETTGGWE